MIIGINATKDAVYIAETSGDAATFQLEKITRFRIELASASDLAELLKNLKTLFSSVGDDKADIAVLCCSSGRYGSSVEAVKAEAIAQLAAHDTGLNVVPIKPQSLKSALGCAAGQTWQARSKEPMNATAIHKHWADGANGAAAAAYKQAAQS
jgi:hypothetical protein